MTRCITEQVRTQQGPGRAAAEVGMLALEVLGGVVVLLALAFVLGRNVAVFDDEPEDVADNGLPVDRLLRSDDIPRLRFRVGIRGYRMSDVDAALDAARRALAAAEGHAEAGELNEQPSGDEDRPLTELEETYRATDETR